MKLKKQSQASRNVSRRAHMEALKGGNKAWSDWCAAARARNPDWRADLRGANLAGLHLWYTDFRRAILSGADLRGALCDHANFRSANLRGANLENATLSFADLRRANLNNANLTNVNLEHAKLQSTHFFETRIEGADLDQARLGNTYFVDVELDTATGLRSVRHYGSSHLSLGTLTRSGRTLPKSFLRGCGVPPLFHTLIGDTEAGRRLAFERLQKGFPLDFPVRYVMHLYHGWRAQWFQSFLNENTEGRWYLINIASASSLQEADLHRMPEKSTVPLIVNSRYLILNWRAYRPIFERLESARRRHRFKIVLVSWRKSKVFCIIKHRWVGMDMFSPLRSNRFDSQALARQLGLL